MSWEKRTAHHLRRAWWRWRRPLTRGARVIVTDEIGAVCLIRHSYGSGWYLPGGGLRRGEEPEDGARREAMEELGVEVELRGLLGTYTSTAEGKRDTVWVFAATALGPPQVASAEVAECCWFSMTNLPEETSPATRRRLEEFAGHRQRQPQW